MRLPALLDPLVLLLQRTLILWLLASSLVAYRWTGWFPHLADPFSKEHFTSVHLYLTIAVTMLAIGLMLPRDEVRQLFRRWPMILAGTAIQYTTMPLLAFLAANLAGLTGGDLIGVVMVGCVPGAMASNVLTLNAGGNTSYSVSLTTTATLLSPLAVPIALGLILATQGAIDRSVLWKSSNMLLLTVVLPVVAGHLIGRQMPETVQHWLKQGSAIVANLAILLIIAVVVGRNRARLAEFRLDLLWVLLFVNVGGYAGGYGGGWLLRLPAPMRRALTLEIGMQNAGLGATLALTLFPGRGEIAIAPAMYTFGCMLTGTILAGLWAMMPPGRFNGPSERPPDPA